MFITRKEAQAVFGDSLRGLAIALGKDVNTLHHLRADEHLKLVDQLKLIVGFPEHFPTRAQDMAAHFRQEMQAGWQWAHRHGYPVEKPQEQNALPLPPFSGLPNTPKD